MITRPSLSILMATYNGEQYLVEQIESILAQTYTDWELVIRDDNSTDGTLEIIKSYVAKDGRIQLLAFGHLHGTACRNFSQLFDWAYQNQKQYTLFADQDDIWLPDKLELSVKKIKEDEQVFGGGVPLAKYSSFQFIDEQGHLINKRLKLPASLGVNVLLNENYAWGCTLILNQAAVKVIQHIPSELVNHDYYIALVLSAFGQISLIDKDLVLYRQHEKNVSGNVNKMSFSSRFNRYAKDSSVMLTPLVQNYELVKVFYEKYAERLPVRTKEMIAGFLNAYQQGFVKLMLTMSQFGIRKIGLGKNAVYFYTLFLYRKQVLDQIYNATRNEDTLR